MEMNSSIYNLFICLVQVENKKGVSCEAGRLSVVKPPPKIRRRQFSISLQQKAWYEVPDFFIFSSHRQFPLYS
jgi:hypothetical protein